MKKTILIFAIFLITWNAVSQVILEDQPYSLKVTNPAYDSKVDPDLNIIAVAFLDRYTAVTFTYKNTSRQARRLFLERSGPEALYISTNRGSYRLLNFENIGDKSAPTIARSGGAYRFTAYFEPLPSNTPSFSLITANGRNSFSFMGVKMESAHPNVGISRLTREYNTMKRYDATRRGWSRPVIVKSTWVFHTNELRDIINIDPNGAIQKYRMKNAIIVNGERNPYQRITVVGDRNQPFILDLYENPTIGLVMQNENLVPIAQFTKR